ncbi:MAG TPA: class I SAM-dependent methyltransferase [Verrucomicrobiae bacterium]|jgi:ubiquinone/menaquinone biosynthesis C-methylase UbiE|nr:class I SAM-dependent methyltransferase [Verrucomicrobiae bacterium]
MQPQNHKDKIIDQFTKQAVPFTQVPGHQDGIEVLLRLSGVTRGHAVLDVACGPGLVGCAFAPHARHVTGVDITAKMIETAKERQREKGLSNLDWKVGGIAPLPFESGRFDAVITRYSFHHFEDPKAALAEMMRVCRPGGTVLVADVALPSEKIAAYDAVEKLRDPSHVHALSLPEFRKLFSESGLSGVRSEFYGVPLELGAQLKASFPNPGDEPKIRAIFEADIGRDALGVGARKDGGGIYYEVPIAVFAGAKV